MFSDKSSSQQSHVNKRQLLSLVVEEAISVRVCQLFIDGNHRTSILSIYEKLADAGWWLHMNAFDLYILISNRHQAEWDVVRPCMVQLILRHLRQYEDISFEALRLVAERVKLIPEINTLCEEAESFLTSKGSERHAKREKWRFFRRQSKKRHVQFVALYGKRHIK